MRYIVIEHNSRDPQNPKVKVFSGSSAKSNALLFDDVSSNTCQIYFVKGDLTLQPVERNGKSS